jgi:hypothetical protein
MGTEVKSMSKRNGFSIDALTPSNDPQSSFSPG